MNRELPVPKYSGIQKVMDDAHAPIIGPKGAEATGDPSDPVVTPDIVPPVPSTAPAGI